MTQLIRSTCAFLILLVAASFASAQVQTGTPAFGSYGGGPDTVNLGNLNDHWQFPIVHKPGRGTDFFYDLVYDSSIWTPFGSGPTKVWVPQSNWGWTAATNFGSGLAGYGTYNSSITYCDTGGFHSGTDSVRNNWAYMDPWGVSHAFPGQMEDKTGTCGNSSTNTVQIEAADGSGYTFDSHPGGNGLRSKTNAQIGAPFYANTSAPPGPYASSITDRNGNQLNNTAGGVFTDTLGKTALTIFGSSPVTFAYTDSTGAPASYIVHYVTKNIKTNFNCASVTEFTQNNVGLVNDITLPDGSAYTFTYEATPSNPGFVTGRIAQVTLPTGGSIVYTYSGGSSGHITCSNGTAATLSRQTPDGTTTYARTLVSGTQWQTIVTDATTAANQTSIQFQGIYETQRKLYNGAVGGTVQQTVNTCYNGAASPCTTTAVATPITQRTVIASLPLPGSLGLQSQHTDNYDITGNLTESDDYALSSTSTFTLLRQTLTTYAVAGTIPLPFPTQVLIKDGTGTIKSRQTIAYDGSALVCVSPALQHDNTNFGCGYTTRFNATSTTGYTDPATPSGAITKNFTYDSTGNLITSQVSPGQLITRTFSSVTDFAYPDSLTVGSSAPQLTTSATYDQNMGLFLTTTDPNNVVTTNSYDNMGRLLTSATGTIPATTYTYTNSGSWTVKVCSPLVSTQTVCQKSLFDGLGRPVTVQKLDATGTPFESVDTSYDAMGRAYKTSNPYTGSPSFWTQLGFDVVGRQTSTTLPDSSVISVSYTDNSTATTDPAGNRRGTTLDSVGRLISAYEPDLTTGLLTVQTTYTYNVFNQLTGVNQGGQTRTYSYDALGRTIGMSTPEAGLVCYGSNSAGACQTDGYDTSNNLLKRTDARGVVTTYLYDTLNRLTGVSYPTVPVGVSAMANGCKANGSATNNANVCYSYGTTATGFVNGRMTSMTDPTGSETYSYDQLANITSLAKLIGSTTYTTGYTYNLANELTQTTYPSGRVVVQNVDTVGRLCSVGASGSGCTTGTLYASGFAYNTAQQVTKFMYGNGIYASFDYSGRTLLMGCLDYSTTNRTSCTHDATTKFGLTYSFPASPANNGQISGITDAVDNGRSVSYTYDALNRLSAATTVGSTGYPKWGVSETYDRWGNRTDENQTFGSAPFNHVTVSSGTNRITSSGYAYDLSGNMTNDGNNTLTYDGENRVTKATNGGASGTYSYDGNGLRIEKVSGTNTTITIFSGMDALAEYVNTTVATSPTNEYAYAGGQKIMAVQSGTTYYFHNDHLSLRLRTTSTGAVADQRGHYPFGETWYSPSGSPLVFTNYYRDAESGNDYAMARSYVSRLGRFSSPDPLAGTQANPQSLNRYTYVLNNPVSLIDPTGLYCIFRDQKTKEVSKIDDTLEEDACLSSGGEWVDNAGLPDNGSVTVTADPLPPAEFCEIVPTLCVAGVPIVPQSGASGGPSLLQVSKDLNRCAAELAKTKSLTALSNGRIPEVLGSNLFSDISTLATGNGGIDQGAGIAADATIEVAEHAAAQVTIGTAVVTSIQVSATRGVYNPVTVTAVSRSFGGTLAGRVGLAILKGASVAKVGWDGAMYLAAEVACAAPAWAD